MVMAALTAADVNLETVGRFAQAQSQVLVRSSEAEQERLAARQHRFRCSRSAWVGKTVPSLSVVTALSPW
jgi:hypothetical protein